MPNNLTNIAWATLPPDGVHDPVWGKDHLVDGKFLRRRGVRTLCGKTVPYFAHEVSGRRRLPRCLSCLRVLDRRRENKPEKSLASGPIVNDTRA